MNVRRSRTCLMSAPLKHFQDKNGRAHKQQQAPKYPKETKRKNTNVENESKAMSKADTF